MKGWLDPSKRVLSAAIQLSLRYPSRIVNHTPMLDCAQAGYLTPERSRAMAKNAVKAREAKRAQQLALLEYDHALGR